MVEHAVDASRPKGNLENAMGLEMEMNMGGRQKAGGDRAGEVEGTWPFMAIRRRNLVYCVHRVDTSSHHQRSHPPPFFPLLLLPFLPPQISPVPRHLAATGPPRLHLTSAPRSLSGLGLDLDLGTAMAPPPAGIEAKAVMVALPSTSISLVFPHPFPRCLPGGPGSAIPAPLQRWRVDCAAARTVHTAGAVFQQASPR